MDGRRRHWQEGPRGRYGRHGVALGIVLGAALLLRLAHWAAVRQAPFVAQLAMDSLEYDRWARQIAAGDWLGHGVFFQAPLYPYLLAVLYQVAGARLDAVYLVQIALGVAGCWALYRAGRRLAGERVGLAAAALAAVYGPFLFYDVQLLKESLAVTVSCFLLWALARAWLWPPWPPWPPRSPRPPRPAEEAPAAAAWFAAGLLLGVLALLRENALLVVPLLLPLAWWSAGWSRPRAAAARAGALAVGTALVLAPVALRNGLVGGDYLPTTFQGGANFYIGNNAAADGTYRPIVPGKQVPELERREPVRLAEQRLGRRLTPREVSSYWLRQGLAWARADPGAFLRLLGSKVGLFWSWYEWPDAVDYYYMRDLSPVFRLPLLEFGGATLLAAVGLGLLLARRGEAESPAGGPLARRFVPVLVFLAAWMAATVVFFLFSRYRLPAVPALLLLAALPVAALAEALAGSGWRGLRSPRTAGLALALVAALALPRLAGYAPRADLVHFNLARLAEARGDAGEARRQYEAVLAASPGDFLAWLDLGNLAVRRHDGARALLCYQRAAALEPASDDAQSNLGGVYLLLGDPAAAAEHLGRALALNPESMQALHNSALLRLRLGDAAGARALSDRALAIDPQDPAARRLAARLAAISAGTAGTPGTAGAPTAPPASGPH